MPLCPGKCLRDNKRRYLPAIDNVFNLKLQPYKTMRHLDDSNFILVTSSGNLSKSFEFLDCLTSFISRMSPKIYSFKEEETKKN